MVYGAALFHKCHTLLHGRWRQQISPKQWYLSTNLHGITFDMLLVTFGCVIVALRKSDLPGVRFAAEARDLSVLQNVPTGCRAHPASYSVSTGDLSQGMKLPVREVDHWPPSSTAEKN